MEIYKKILKVFFLFLLMSACTPQKKLVYLQNIETGIHDTGRSFEYRLRPGDLLSINVFSTNEKATLLFKYENSSIATQDVATYLNGFIVSDSGEINMPMVGRIYVAGITPEEAARKIELEVKDYFFDAVVDVKLLSFQITILGEVKRPGTFNIFKPKINILQAIALAGDLDVYGKREIMLIRETGENHEIFKIDLKDRNLMSHECYYLLPNDIIYVEPHKAKVFGFSTVPITLLFTTVSALVLILNYFK